MNLAFGNTSANNATGPHVTFSHNNNGDSLFIAVHSNAGIPTIVAYGLSMPIVAASGGGFNALYVYQMNNPALGVNNIDIFGPNQRYDYAAVSVKAMYPEIGATFTGAAAFAGAPPVYTMTPNTDIGDIGIAFIRLGNPSIATYSVTTGTSLIAGEIDVAYTIAGSPTSTIEWTGSLAYNASGVAFALRESRSDAFLLNLI